MQLLCVGLPSSDTYMKIAKEQEMERQTRRNKKAAKQRTSKSGKRRKHVADDEPEDDIPVMHVVSTTIDAPEVLAAVAKSRVVVSVSTSRSRDMPTNDMPRPIFGQIVQATVRSVNGL